MDRREPPPDHDWVDTELVDKIGTWWHIPLIVGSGILVSLTAVFIIHTADTGAWLSTDQPRNRVHCTHAH